MREMALESIVTNGKRETSLENIVTNGKRETALENIVTNRKISGRRGIGRGIERVLESERRYAKENFHVIRRKILTSGRLGKKRARGWHKKINTWVAWPNDLLWQGLRSNLRLCYHVRCERIITHVYSHGTLVMMMIGSECQLLQMLLRFVEYICMRFFFYFVTASNKCLFLSQTWSWDMPNWKLVPRMTRKQKLAPLPAPWLVWWTRSRRLLSLPRNQTHPPMNDFFPPRHNPPPIHSVCVLHIPFRI